jgi:hypothetical protein
VRVLKTLIFFIMVVKTVVAAMISPQVVVVVGWGASHVHSDVVRWSQTYIRPARDARPVVAWWRKCTFALVVLVVKVVVEVSVFALGAALAFPLGVVAAHGNVQVVGVAISAARGPVLLQTLRQLACLVKVLFLLPRAVQKLAGWPMAARVLKVMTKSELRLASCPHVYSVL